MDSDVKQSALFYRMWAWGEAHTKQLLIGLIAVVLVGVGITIYFVHQNQVQDDANNALSKLLVRTSPTMPEPTPEAFMKVANDFPNTDAGKRALLLAASEFFAQGKYDEARSQFQRFLQEHADSPFVGQAALGIASSMEAQGKIDDAINAYRNTANRYQTPNVALQAEMALARLYQSQGKLVDARNELQVVATNPPPFSSEARVQLEKLFIEHPELFATNQPTSPLMRAAPPAPNRPTTPPAPATPAPAGPAVPNKPPSAVPMTNKPPASFPNPNKP